jgi:hypothetical protein
VHGLLGKRERREELLRGGGTGSERKKIGKVPGEARFYFLDRDASRKQFFKGGGLAVGDAAGNDEVEIAQVG